MYFVLSRCFWNDDVEDDEIGGSGICSMHGSYEKFVPKFSCET